MVDMSAKRQTSKGSRFLKMLWLIPIIVLGYIGYINLLPFGGTLTYLIDVGGEDTAGETRITGPFNRISDKMMVEGTTFRELQKSGVHFELEDHRLGITEEVEIRVRFKDNFPADGKFLMGATEKERQSYYWKDIYVPFYKQLTDFTPLVENGNIKVYVTGEESSASFGSVEEFQQNPPLSSMIARNDKSISINQKMSPEDNWEIDVGEFATGDVRPLLLGEDVDEDGYLETDTSLKGLHMFYFFASDDTLELQITKRDLNWYDGDDILDVLVYSLDGTLKARRTIPDDGDATGSRNLGDPQHSTLTLDNLERGLYKLVLEPISKDDDLVMTHLGLNQQKLVVVGGVYLAGSFYLQEEARHMSMWFYLFKEGEIKFGTLHDSTLQAVTLSGEGYNQTVNIDAVERWFSPGLLKPGIYQITADKGNVFIEAPNGYFAFDEDSLFLPTSSSNHEENGSLFINTALRGGHSFWSYVNNDSLELLVTKQDMNRKEGLDELKIKVYSFEGELVGEASILDDGDEGKSSQYGPLQSESLRIQGLEQGAYRIVLEGQHDLLIRGIEINQDKLVLDKNVYLGGIYVVYSKGGLVFDPVSLYGRNFAGGELKFSAWKRAGLQRVIIRGSSFYTEVNVNELATEFNTILESGAHQLILPKQDMYIESSGYLSFTPGSFFLPKRCEVVDLKYDLAWVRENIDYMIVDYKDYVAPVENDGWMVAQASWKKEELFIKGNKLRFRFSVPHLDQTETKDRTILVDWIEVSLKVLPIWERVGWLDQVVR